jgi:23S rRNA pseudouridine1911/1915/1917 synthase
MNANRRSFQPDQIEEYRPKEQTTLLKFLNVVLAGRSNTTIKGYLKRQHCMINGVPTTQYNAPIGPEDVLSINLTRPYVTFQNRMVNLLYEDDDLIVVEKKSGLLSVGVPNNREYTCQGIVERYIQRCYGHGHAYIVHRLDQYTSGILIFAKNRETMNLLRDAWNNYVVERRYVAVVEGVPEKEEGECVSYLTENDAYRVYSTDIPEDGKLAVTRYKVIKTKGNYSMLDILILTGRKNQIRVHMSEMGHPVAGDKKYEAKTNPCGRLMLHNSVLQFIHPRTHRQMRFELPIPKCFTL